MRNNSTTFTSWKRGIPQSIQDADGTTQSTVVKGAGWITSVSEEQFTYGNGRVHTLTQNARQLPARSIDSGGAMDLTYAYDGNGNVTAITDSTVAGRQTRSMRYDGLDRLKQASSPMFGTANYAYDAADNLTQVSVSGGSQPRNHYYCYNAGTNRLAFVRTGPSCSTSPATIALTYDVQGNLSAKNGAAYTFDYGNRLRSAQGTETYYYDAQGRRVRTSGTGGLLYEMYSLDGKLLWQRDERIMSRFQYVYLNGSAVAVRKRPIGAATEELFYWHTDALGSQVAASLGTSVVQTSEYEPYGALLNRSPNNRIGYTGHVMDAVTGLTYMQQRYYDPAIGRFLSVDPVTAYSNPVGAFNRYWYANNNPYRFTDPDGRWVEDIVIGVPSIVLGAKSLAANVRSGSWGAAAIDAVGIVADGAAILAPGVPGGASAAIGAVRIADKAIDVERGVAVANKGIGANPFKGKSFEEIDKILTGRGFKKAGTDPASGKGSYFHPETGRKYFMDEGRGGYKNGMRENPHVDVHRMRDGVSVEAEKRKYPLGDRLYERE